MAIKLGWSSQSDDQFGFRESGGSWNSPIEVEWFLIGVDVIVKNKRRYLCFYKKGYRYKDKLGSKKIATVLWQWH
jgi:hypothetical protein